MTDTTRGMVRSVLTAHQEGALTFAEALDCLVALDIAPRVAGILLRHSLGPSTHAVGSERAIWTLSTVEPLALGA